MWYNRVVANLGEIPACIDYYEGELSAAKSEIAIRGNVEKSLSNLPGVTEHRFNQLQEIEAILNFLNIQLRKIRRKHFQKYPNLNLRFVKFLAICLRKDAFA